MQMKAIEKKLQKIEKVEARLRRNGEKKTEPVWKTKIEEKIPEKVMNTLQKAFSGAFYLIFEKGSVIIEKTYQREEIEKEFLIRDYAIGLKGGKKEIRNIRKDAASGNIVSTLITTVEGIGLGALGIGLPDIVFWVCILLRGVYETALKYGFEYETPEERMFILTMLEAAMSNGEAWTDANGQVDAYIQEDVHMIPSKEELKEQIEQTANAFATDMLVTKFIQGLPVVGIIGGATNPVYYNKVMSYVELKYRKRYLLGKQKGEKYQYEEIIF